jgi:hypothetical protein
MPKVDSLIAESAAGVCRPWRVGTKDETATGSKRQTVISFILVLCVAVGTLLLCNELGD